MPRSSRPIQVKRPIYHVGILLDLNLLVYKHQYLGHITVQYIHCGKHKYNRQRGKEIETLQNKAQGRKVSKKVEIKKTS